MAPDRERSRSPMGRIPLPATVMNVKMCCTKCEEKAKEECAEVEGVVKVVTDQSENKVIVYGMADPPALLKKMRRHLDKHAMYWPTDDANPVAPPLFPAVDTSAAPLYDSTNGGIGAAQGPPLHTSATVLPTADPRVQGVPLGDARREILHQRELQDAAAKSREREAGRVIPPRDNVREVVFVDAKDGAPVDPRAVRELDPAAAAPPHYGRNFGVDARDLVRPVERMELRGDEYPRPDPNHSLAQAPAPRRVDFVPVDAVKDVNPRQVQHHPRDGHAFDRPPHVLVDAAGRPLSPGGHGPGELREVRRIHDPRDHPPVREIREMRPIGPGMRPMDVANGDHPPVREVHEVRPIGPGMRQVDVANDQLRPVDPRNMMSNGPDPREPVLDRGRIPVPVRTGRDSREVRFVPDPGPAAGQHRSSGNNLSPRSPRSPRDAEYQSPRQHYAAPDHGPRSPRGDHAAWDYYPGTNHGQAPRSPRFEGPGAPRSPGRGRAAGGDDYDPRARPVLDRELSFNEFGPGPAMDRGVKVPLPYEPQDAAAGAAAASFDFHGPGPARQPRSPRSSISEHDLHGPQLVRGYGDIDPHQFRPAFDPASTSPRNTMRPVQRYSDIHQDAAAVMRDRDDNLYRSRDGSGLSPRSQHGPQYYNSESSMFRSAHDELGGDVRREYYEPKQSYFSDYHPSQNYQPGPLASQDIDEMPAANPLYKKHGPLPNPAY